MTDAHRQHRPGWAGRGIATCIAALLLTATPAVAGPPHDEAGGGDVPPQAGGVDVPPRQDEAGGDVPPAPLLTAEPFRAVEPRRGTRRIEVRFSITPVAEPTVVRGAIVGGTAGRSDVRLRAGSLVEAVVRGFILPKNCACTQLAVTPRRSEVNSDATDKARFHYPTLEKPSGWTEDPKTKRWSAKMKVTFRDSVLVTCTGESGTCAATYEHWGLASGDDTNTAVTFNPGPAAVPATIVGVEPHADEKAERKCGGTCKGDPKPRNADHQIVIKLRFAEKPKKELTAIAELHVHAMVQNLDCDPVKAPRGQVAHFAGTLAKPTITLDADRDGVENTIDPDHTKE